MKKILSILGLAMGLTSCYNYSYTPVAHSNNFKLSEIDFTQEFKVGKSCAKLKGVHFDGSRSIIDAAKNANIKTVVFVDHEKQKKIFSDPLFCTIVYGK